MTGMWEMLNEMDEEGDELRGETESRVKRGGGGKREGRGYTFFCYCTRMTDDDEAPMRILVDWYN